MVSAVPQSLMHVLGPVRFARNTAMSAGLKFLTHASVVQATKVTRALMDQTLTMAMRVCACALAAMHHPVLCFARWLQVQQCVLSVQQAGVHPVAHCSRC